MSEITMNIERMEHIINIFGSFDGNLKLIEDALEVKISDRDSEIKISGSEESCDTARRVIEGLLNLAERGEQIEEQNVRYVIGLVKAGEDESLSKISRDVICITARGNL